MPTKNREVFPRGVWKAPFLDNGFPVAIAVDSKGHRLAMVVLKPDVDRAECKRMLMQLLEWCDPQPRLALVDAGSDSEEFLSTPSYLLYNRHRA